MIILRFALILLPFLIMKTTFAEVGPPNACTTLDECKTIIADLQKQVSVLNNQIQVLKSSPQELYKDIVARHEKIANSNEGASLVKEIAEFVLKFPQAKEEIKALGLIKKSVQKRTAILAAEESRLKREEAVSEVRSLIKSGITYGGLDVPTSLAVADYLAKKNILYDDLSKLPKSKYMEAMKDPESERGKAMTLRGQIIQISRDGNYFTGLIHSNGNIYSFLTGGTTNGIVQGKWCEFGGILVQRYSYSNSGGGTTHSLHLVGFFRNQVMLDLAH